MRKRLMILLLLLLLPAAARGEGVSGQAYRTFEEYYKDDLVFINENANRHLLPLVIASSSSQVGDGRKFYQILGDVLSMTIRTDPSGEVIERCEITLTAPAGMELGNAVYNDFAISGYHSYALLMAMDVSASAYERYAMVTKVEEGMKRNDGVYSVQVGVYALNCQRQNGTVSIVFDNALSAPADPAWGSTPAADQTPSPVEMPVDEGAGLG